MNIEPNSVIVNGLSTSANICTHLRVLAGRKRDHAERAASLAEANQRLGRLRERYPLVARYLEAEIAGDEHACTFAWHLDADRLALAEQLDGAYLMRTDRTDLTADEAWKTYVLLTRVETPSATSRRRLPCAPSSSSLNAASRPTSS